MSVGASHIDEISRTLRLQTYASQPSEGDCRSGSTSDGTSSCLGGNGFHLDHPFRIGQPADDNPGRCRSVAWCEIFLAMHLEILQSIRVGGIDVEADNVLRTHPGVGEN